MPQYKMYWFSEFHYERIATAMTLKKFLHLTDNTTKENSENANDKLFKVRPLLELIRNNCIKIKPKHCLSIN